MMLFTKQQAQDELMHALTNSVLNAAEQNKPEDLIKKMREQSIRVGKMFGYKSWPGLGDFSSIER